MYDESAQVCFQTALSIFRKNVAVLKKLWQCLNEPLCYALC